MRYLLAPDIFSLLRGKWREERRSQFLLLFWILSGVFAGLATHALLERIFG
jgi:hypothetical protein